LYKQTGIFNQIKLIPLLYGSTGSLNGCLFFIAAIRLFQFKKSLFLQRDLIPTYFRTVRSE